MHFENQDLVKEMLKNYGQHLGIFFFGQGILTDHVSKQPLMSTQDTINKLSLIINAAHLHENTLALNCKEQLTDEELLEQGFCILPVKTFLAGANPLMQAQVLKAFHWLNWDLSSQFCGRCSFELSKKIDSIEKKCERCDITLFPKMSPAVMVLIYRDKEILLARSWHFRAGMYSAIAGFIELGETAEMAAIREAKEELGVDIENLEYFGTQTWPFPDSFMIAFKAKFKEGELKIDPVEIEAAQWFNIDNLPILPPSASISRKLIESVIQSW